MVQQQSLDEVVARLLVVLGDVLEGGVEGHEEGVVAGVGAVEQLDHVRVVVDNLGELSRVLAVADDLVDGLLGELVLVAAVEARRHLVPLSLYGIGGVLEARLGRVEGLVPGGRERLLAVLDLLPPRGVMGILMAGLRDVREGRLVWGQDKGRCQDGQSCGYKLHGCDPGACSE